MQGEGTDKHTKTWTNFLTTRKNPPKGRFFENICKCISVEFKQTNYTIGTKATLILSDQVDFAKGLSCIWEALFPTRLPRIVSLLYSLCHNAFYFTLPWYIGKQGEFCEIGH